MNKYSLASVANSYADNAGGLCSFVFVPIDWIATDAKINNITNKAYVAPTLKSGKSWLSAKVLQDSLQFSESTKVTESGIMLEQQLSGVLNGDTDENNRIMHIMSLYEFVVIYKGRNGESKIIGNSLAGLKFKSDFSTDAAFSGKHAFAFMLTMQAKEPAHHYPL